MKNFYTILIAVFSFTCTFSSMAQEKSVSGTVTSKSDGSTLPGVSIVVQGTTKGTETDFDGKYTITTSVGDILSFSFLGMKTKTITVSESNTINVVLEDDADQLDEIVVTALGIKKSRKTLTYSAQDVKGDDLTRVKQTNPINSLSGKSAGLTITRSASGVGGATKVVLRGNSSTSNNDPLYVIDGVPMSNSGNGQNGDSGNGRGIFGGDAGN
ncbi:carboxypeptidase-like regulatory domain-containing protein [Polaribacter sp. MSW5]|uniref:Carboxypeptidase-like regulatory domain-containing protein n=1 Tax=Polaribacter ponticola TaxID=2978475 RepID=A0ABT5SCD6_9FLAO|nr:carboxypeptidase-like regulatory domain-containing protein [Polaribacter sp. MSW5]MDD7915773.1 carboxypeptidase-like regulatory domain-containing protein [Polaribacter sp. MSW5]